MASERIKKLADDSVFGRNLANYCDFISWARFYPDLFLDLLKPEKGGINLHLDQRVFLRADIRFMSMYGVFSRGYGKCISGDSLIFTDKGIKEIGEFFNYQSNDTETYYETVENVVNRYGKLEKTKFGLYNGKKECNKITTNEGYSLTATKNHRVLTMLPDGNIDWVRTDHLKVGDYVVINRKNDVWGNKTDISNIMECNKTTVSKYLMELFDSNGYVSENMVFLESVSEKYLQRIQILLLNFGIVSSIKSKNESDNILCIDCNNIAKFKEEIGFSIKEKQDSLEKIYTTYCNTTKLANDNYYYSQIKEISSVVTDTYDFHIPETHSFVSNGFVSHNTFDEVLAMVVVAILYPNIELALSAQTKQNATSLLRDKWNEISKLYPLLNNELQEKPKFSKDNALILFKNGSSIDAIANAQTSKGQRRRRLKIEESALLNNVLFQDALEPVVEVPRLTSGRLSIVDPMELNQQIHFFTTAGFKGTDEYQRNVTMLDDMENLKGKIVLGSNWQLPCWYGRGSSKSQILQKKKNTSYVSFLQNYEQVWVGASDGALVNINSLLNCRTLHKPELKAANEDDEYYLGVDVARSQKSSNNQSSVVVAKVKRSNDGKILSVEIVNIVNIPNILNFSAQAIRIKQLQKKYNAKMVIIDGNGLGSGLVDQCLRDSIDPSTGENLGCWDTVNDDNEPETPNSPKILYNLKAQGKQNEIVTNFIDMVDSGKLRLLERKQENDFTEGNWDNFDNEIRPFVETDAFIEETANLKLKRLPSGSVTIEQVVRKVNKDRVSALIYVLWYIDKFEKESQNTEYEFSVFIN